MDSIRKAPSGVVAASFVMGSVRAGKWSHSLAIVRSRFNRSSPRPDADTRRGSRNGCRASARRLHLSVGAVRTAVRGPSPRERRIDRVTKGGAGGTAAPESPHGPLRGRVGHLRGEADTMFPTCKTIAASAVATALLGTFAGTALASSHAEAPFIKTRPKLDATDFYAFSSYEPGREDYVTLIANYVPLQDAYGGPNYFAMNPDAIYEIHVDNDGDAREDITFLFDFDNGLRNEERGLSLQIGDQSVPVPLKNIGPLGPFDNRDVLNVNETYFVGTTLGERRGQSPVWAERSGSRRALLHQALRPRRREELPRRLRGLRQEPHQHRRALPRRALRPVPRGSAGRAGVHGPEEGQLLDRARGDLRPGELRPPRRCHARRPAARRPGRQERQHPSPWRCTRTAWWGRATGRSGRGRARACAAPRPSRASRRSAARSATRGSFQQVSRLGSPLVNEVVIGLPDKDRVQRERAGRRRAVRRVRDPPDVARR